MRSNGHVRFLRISRRVQMVAVASLLLFALLWLSMTIATLVMRIDVERRNFALREKAALVAQSAGRAQAMHSSVDSIAERLEARQHQLDTVVGRYFGTVGGKAATPRDRVPVAAADDRLDAIEKQQMAFAASLSAAAAERSRTAEKALRRFGVNPRAVAGRAPQGIGGPFVPLPASAGALANLGAMLNRLDKLERAVLALPATMPALPLSFSSPFGVRSDPFNGRAAMHTGLDIRGQRGQPIYAAAAGRVVRVGSWSGYGNVVVIDHGHGLETRYGHLSGFDVRSGAIVQPGQKIARMGSTGRSTGTHLHFEVRVNGRAVNPRPFLEASADVREIQAEVGSRFAQRGRQG